MLEISAVNSFGVSCDSCLKGNFRGRRYKCLICYDYDLCALCYEAGATTTRHTTEHPMQCILTRSDFDLYYGGEALTVEQPQAFTCPYCGKMGFTELTLQEHVTSEHSETSFEVVCPVCASLPGGDPNLVTDDFAGHLTVEHRSGPRDLISFLDEPAGSRHGVRRIPHASRGVGGSRARRSNMHFSSSGGLSSLSPSSRESVDPIAELLSQLSGVRRSAGGQGSTPSQLQQLQMQLQLERQQAARQQLERLPRRQTQTASSANSAGAGTATAATAATTAVPLDASSSQAAQSNSQFLLSRCMDSTLTDLELQSVEQERADRSLFVQELVLATLTEGAASLLLEGASQDCASGSRKEREETGSRSSPVSEGNSDGNSGSSRASPSTSGASGTGSQQQSSMHQQQQKAASLVVPKRSSSRSSGNSAGATGLASSLPRQQIPAGASSSSSLATQQQPPQHHDLRGGIRSNFGGGGGGMLTSQQQQQVRVLTGTGTIREVVPSTPVVGGGYGGRGGSVRGGAGASSPGPTRRKPVRPVEGRNQSTEPPPPH
ncbi:E3 ubiquitin-protein ligase KCMF1 isoform X2 [Zootermopsis nevadensis]|uniref:E3 ubiquitin-protein ligase KCMF1 isoform X2 n=1 Tax=Zootermopsis nevadensis TaxID=136037 RepID=UPI000B8EBFE5|nr:E3 ubiquitin-protein ligase KCMF1 isoform X2 [Zootermopsis nevadensis]